MYGIIDQGIVTRAREVRARAGAIHSEDTVTDTPTAPRRGRDIRLARARTQAAKYPYIRRKLPVVELLSSEAVEIIEANAETILEDIGIEFRRDPESLRLWREAGADVTGERVHIPYGLARQLLKTAPREFTLYARNPARNVPSAAMRPCSRRWAARRSSTISIADVATARLRICRIS